MIKPCKAANYCDNPSQSRDCVACSLPSEIEFKLHVIKSDKQEGLAGVAGHDDGSAQILQ